MKVIELQRLNALQQREARRLQAIKAAALYAQRDADAMRLAKLSSIMHRELRTLRRMDGSSLQCYVNTF